ncbi:hypothetical protein Fot_02437 [Forsythia ovata]|uniref:Uncharacterized protein n=1 Tax=Forsythia ovata TaxID=205694 RepID=A0ABD1X6V5_9LAMI
MAVVSIILPFDAFFQPINCWHNCLLNVMSRIESNRLLDSIYSPNVHEELRRPRCKNPERGSDPSRGNPNRPLPKSGSAHISPHISPRALDIMTCVSHNIGRSFATCP